MPSWAIAIVSLIGGFIFHVVYENYREKRKARNESLRNHFKSLEIRVIKPLIEITGQITNSEGTLSIKGASYGSPAYASLIRNLEQGDFDIFKLHFPDLAKKATNLVGEVDKHNKLSKSFLNNLKGLIEEKTGLAVEEGKGRPFIFTNVPYHLRRTLCDLTEDKPLRHDFRQARIERKNDFWEVRTGSTSYAEVTTEEEGNSCKSGLIELMESTEPLEEMSSILKRVNQLENESRSVADLLDFTCRQYGELGQLLNEEKECPYCQVIFHLKKNRGKFV